jgi:cytoskeleton protein RodZ
MSDNLTLSDAESMQGQFASNSHVTAGQMLKKARLDAGLHIAALAVSLRVPVKRIEALENGQMDLLPDMVFVRALTSSICQALKIDPAPILEKLPKAVSPRLNGDDVGINTPIGFSGASKESVLFGLFTSPWFLGIVFLCAGAAGIYLWPKASVLSVPEAAISPKVVPELGISQAKEVQVVTESSVAPNLTASSSLAGASIASNATIVAAPPVAETAAIAVPAPAPVITATTPIAASTGDKLVTFKATGQTWVEVKNASGATVFKKLLNEGESAGTTGMTPLTVIVGRADVTQVEVRGKPVNLTPISKSNVARFEVN